MTSLLPSQLISLYIAKLISNLENNSHEQQSILEWQHTAIENIRYFSLEQLISSILLLREHIVSNDFLRYWEHWVSKNISDLKLSQLPSMMTILDYYHTRFYDKIGLFIKVEQVCNGFLSQMSTTDIIDNLHMLKMMSWNPSPRYMTTWKKVMSQCPLETLDTTLIIKTMTNLRTVRRDDLLVDVIKHLEGAVDFATFNPAQVSLFMNTYRELLILPGQDLLARLQNHLIKTIPGFLSTQAIQLLYSFASLGINPTNELMNVWLQFILDSYTIISLDMLGLAIYSLAMLFVKHRTSSVMTAFTYMVSRMNQSIVTPIETCMTERSVRVIKTLTGLKLNWVYKVPESGYCVTRPGKMSGFERDVMSQLSPDDWQTEFWSYYSLSHIDFMSTKYKVILEVDGDHHFIVDGANMVRRPQDLINEILWKSEFPTYRIVRIAYYEWRQMNGSQKLELINSVETEPAVKFNVNAPEYKPEPIMKFNVNAPEYNPSYNF